MEANIFTYEQLRTAGMDRKMINDLIERGVVERIGKGWYAQAGARTDAVSAIRAGARLGCLSGCRAHGLWVPWTDQIHAVFGRGVRAVQQPGMVLHRHDAPQPSTPIWPLEDCLEQVIYRHDLETSLIVVESAVDKRLLNQYEAEAMVAKTPHGDLRRYLSRARSGSETRVRLFFQLRGVRVVALPVIPGVGEVDMKVGDRLLIECDSEAHHTSKADRLVDATRDINTHLKRYDRIRLAYDQIWRHWGSTRAGLSAILRQRRHLYRQRPSSAVTPRGKAQDT